MTSDWSCLPDCYMKVENSYFQLCYFLCDIKIIKSSDRILMMHNLMFLPNCADLYSMGLRDVVSGLSITLQLLKPEQELKSWYSD